MRHFDTLSDTVPGNSPFPHNGLPLFGAALLPQLIPWGQMHAIEDQGEVQCYTSADIVKASDCVFSQPMDNSVFILHGQVW